MSHSFKELNLPELTCSSKVIIQMCLIKLSFKNFSDNITSMIVNCYCIICFIFTFHIFLNSGEKSICKTEMLFLSEDHS